LKEREKRCGRREISDEEDREWMLAVWGHPGRDIYGCGYQSNSIARVVIVIRRGGYFGDFVGSN